MFESVATARPSPRRRKAGALLLALVFVGAAGSALALAGSQLVTELAEGPPIDVRLDEPMSREALAAPPAPATVRRGVEDPGDDAAETPPEEPPTPPTSDPDGAAAEPEADISNGLGGGPQGHPEGDPDGAADGELGGDGAGGDGDGGGGGLRSVHWTEVKVKRQVQPVYPPSAQAMHLEGSCALRFVIDERGVPTSVTPTACPVPFQESALAAASQWRFYPMKVNGAPQPATFQLVIHFRLSE
ncbi:energy transducer TonB [Myxococcota bacterium]|nr:energy transducer TonB [Myxococcota bacterium]